jgi:tetratricopeptide (TPR) repeat protein
MSADDRSGIYGVLVEARGQANDEGGKHQTAEAWAAFLERAAASAQTPEQRAVYDSHRLSVYLQLGEPDRALPMLEASERDLPDDYNPPARLALAYRAMKRWGDALAASDRALARAYGPRRLVILQARTDIYLGKGDKEQARATLQQAISEATSLPAGQVSENTLAALRRKLEGIQ